MTSQLDMGSLLQLRRVTSAVSKLLEDQLNNYLVTLAPLLQPRVVLGRHTRGSDAKIRGSDQIFTELRELYLSVARSSPYGLRHALESPVSVESAVPTIVPAQYLHVVNGPSGSREITVVSPLRWILTYSGFTPARVRSALEKGSGDASGKELQQVVLQFSLMRIVTAHQSGLRALLTDLGYTISYGNESEFGELPLTHISTDVGTVRPPDDVVLQVSEVSGSMVFQELLNTEDVKKMRMPLKQRLLAELRRHTGDFSGKFENM